MSMTNSAIDIVIPFLNPESKSWQAEFAKYKEQEGIKGANRFRDWGTMRYVLRGIETNCPWVNKVHLILFDESMVPNWLNTANPKLHICYHRDYIPKQFLPTFSSSVIEMFIHRIPSLAENFIYSCDDMLFVKPIPNDYFFKNNKPVSPLKSISASYNAEIDDWCKIENNNYRLEAKLLGKLQHCDHPHFQIPFNKTFIEFVWYKLESDFIKGLSHSKMRNKYENQIWIFDDLQRLTNHAITDINIFKNAKIYQGNNSGNFSEFKGKNIVCFNDIDSQRNYETVKKKFIQYMESVLPKKSSFER